MAGDHPNIVLVVMDTARADSFEPFGAPPGATPVLARMAREGTAFTAFAPACWTVPSLCDVPGWLAAAGWLPQHPWTVSDGWVAVAPNELGFEEAKKWGAEPAVLRSALDRAEHEAQPGTLGSGPSRSAEEVATMEAQMKLLGHL